MSYVALNMQMLMSLGFTAPNFVDPCNLHVPGYCSNPENVLHSSVLGLSAFAITSITKLSVAIHSPDLYVIQGRISQSTYNLRNVLYKVNLK